MRKVLIGLGAVTFAAAAVGTGCSGVEPNPDGAGAGGQAAGSAGASSKGGTPGTSGSGNTAGSTGVAGSAGTGSGGGGTCVNGSECGGSAVGSWTVASSCLTLSGDMDVSRLSLGCPTVPVNGSLQTTGTLELAADGSYTDNTTTTGTVSFPLAPACLSVSSVAVACDRAARIFTAAGWKDAVCTETNGQCACTLNTTQPGGPGVVASYTEPTGRYTTTGSTLSIDIIEYAYCASGNTLSLTPKMSALTGTVTLQKEGGAGAGGAGGASSGGSAGAGAGTSGAGGSGGAAGSGGSGTSGAGGAGGASGGAGGASGGSGGSGGGGPTSTGPCDIYAAGETPCVAAHSTVRALFGAYDGNLYQVKRSDGMTHDIPVKSTGGFADAAAQESFCSGSSCTIWRIYDQSGMGNFLEAETPESTVGGRQGQTAANAAAESLNVSGNKVYSLYTRPSQAYWRDGSQSGLPLGAEPQGVYMVTSGTHFNGGCCYNYGNAQTSRTYEGGPTMDSVYFGNCTIWGKGAGEGPWVMADMEDGIVSGRDTGTNNNSPSMPYDFVTAMEKNNGTTEFALRGSNASMGDLVTIYKGQLPNGKNPMKKEGAIVLGSGGDCCYSNNNASEGTFYEGAIVDGYPSDATEDAVHENIVSAGYGK